MRIPFHSLFEDAMGLYCLVAGSIIPVDVLKNSKAYKETTWRDRREAPEGEPDEVFKVK